MPDPTPVTPPVVPPQPTEVTVRTLASDTAAISASGGVVGSLSPQSVTFAQAHPVQSHGSSHFLSSILSWLAVFLALVALGAGGWLGYGYLTQETVTTPTATSSTPTGAVATSTTGLALLPSTVPAHKSLLSKAAASTVSFPLIAPTGTLKTHFQLIREGLAKIPASSRVAEIVPTDASGKPLSFPGYVTTIGAPDLMSRGAFEGYLQDDFTLLAVRGQGGFSAAYILSLKPGTAWLYAEPGVRAIESAPTLPNLFLQIPGSQSQAFTDIAIQDQPARTATYENPAGTLTYGFFRDRLIIATSRQALDEALLLLCFAPGSC